MTPITFLLGNIWEPSAYIILIAFLKLLHFTCKIKRKIKKKSSQNEDEKTALIKIYWP
jgi:hypothetical protein